MRKIIVSKVSAAVFSLTLLLVLANGANAAATIVIQNNDSPNVGFNDPTPVAPVGNNSGTTLGQQRLNAFQFAANIWGATLNSNVTITVRATWEALSCSTNSGTLGSAGTTTIHADFANAPVPGTWYSASLANSLAGSDLNGPTAEISARFNVNLGNAGCLTGFPFYLGLDNNHGANVDLVAVVMHELTHGFGFQTFTNTSSGAQNSGVPSIYDNFLFDKTANKTWTQMTTNAERQASAINTGNLVWNGTRVVADVPSVLGTPRLRINAPGGIAGNYTVGTAEFGVHLSTAGITGDVAQASPADGCSALTNGAAITGHVALIDRGGCTFVVKVKNAQNAGAKAVVMANNDGDNPNDVAAMGGGDVSISIPSVMVSLNDGNTLKAQLGAGLNGTLRLDSSVPQGADAQARPLINAPNPLQSGSSVSHWATSEFPNQLMEPANSGDLTHSVAVPLDLTLSQLRDVGWSANPIGDASFFVRQHYLDFFSREPDPPGFDFWTKQIYSCGINQSCVRIKTINASAAFFVSVEFQQTGYLVERLYRTAYGEVNGNSTNAPNPHTLKVPVVRRGEFLTDTQQIGQGLIVGQTGWEQVLENNKQAFTLAFVQRLRFTNAFPTSLTPAQFVDALNTNAGLVLSTSERDTAIALFGGAGDTSNVTARSQALRQVAEDQDLYNAEFNKAFVLMQYFGYLQRDPNSGRDIDYSGYEFWLTKLNAKGGDYINAQMVQAFIDSGEYRNRFGS